MNSTKAFEIPKALVWEAYQDVKRSAGGPGVDRQRMEDFERDLKNELYKVWNRMSSGSYFPPPVLRVEIPKADGGMRELGIPTIGDRVAQAVVKRYLEPLVEPYFHEDSYGYRPGRSALDAVAKARQRCWRDNWVLDLDISKFFDTLDHDLVMRAVRRFTNCKWVLLYIDRWLKAEVVVRDGTLHQRDTGTPQGGVISPLLANIFLHLAFDQWMAKTRPTIRFERYADDIVVHCGSQPQLEVIKREIERRLERCRLKLNPEKTRVVYCKGTGRTEDWPCQSFTFLGYLFRPRSARTRYGEFFVSFRPSDQSEGIAYASAADPARVESHQPHAPRPEHAGSAVKSDHCRLDKLLRSFLSVCSALRFKSCQPGAGPMGHAEVQEVPSSTYPCPRMVNVRRAAGPNALCALAISRLDDKSRMSREVHVRFCERLGGRFLGSTRPVVETFFKTIKSELIWRTVFMSRSQAEAAIAGYIDGFYNPVRRHSTLDFTSPVKFEAEAMQTV